MPCLLALDTVRNPPHEHVTCFPRLTTVPPFSITSFGTTRPQFCRTAQAPALSFYAASFLCSTQSTPCCCKHSITLFLLDTALHMSSENSIDTEVPWPLIPTPLQRTWSQQSPLANFAAPSCPRAWPPPILTTSLCPFGGQEGGFFYFICHLSPPPIE